MTRPLETTRRTVLKWIGALSAVGASGAAIAAPEAPASPEAFALAKWQEFQDALGAMVPEGCTAQIFGGLRPGSDSPLLKVHVMRTSREEVRPGFWMNIDREVAEIHWGANGVQRYEGSRA